MKSSLFHGQPSLRQVPMLKNSRRTQIGGTPGARLFSEKSTFMVQSGLRSCGLIMAEEKITASRNRMLLKPVEVTFVRFFSSLKLQVWFKLLSLRVDG